MKTQIQNSHLTDGVTLPRQRMTDRTCLLTFITSAFFVLTATLQVKAQDLAAGIMAARVAVPATFPSGSITSSPDGNFPLGMLLLDPHPAINPNIGRRCPPAVRTLARLARLARCMGRHLWVGQMVMARCSPSTPMA